jgi:hypothetical protein
VIRYEKKSSIYYDFFISPYPRSFDTCDLLCPSSLDLIWLILGEKQGLPPIAASDRLIFCSWQGKARPSKVSTTS